jgi:hypothetical protein
MMKENECVSCGFKGRGMNLKILRKNEVDMKEEGKMCWLLKNIKRPCDVGDSGFREITTTTIARR